MDELDLMARAVLQFVGSGRDGFGDGAADAEEIDGVGFTIFRIEL